MEHYIHARTLYNTDMHRPWTRLLIFICMLSSSFTMQQPGINLAPNTRRPPTPLVSAGARARWSRSGHLAVLPGHSLRSRHVRALAVPSPNSCSLRGISDKDINQDKKLRVDKFFELEMSVRDGDIDQYGVVHHAIYPTYIHKAREEMAASLGISTDSIAHTGNAMALSELNLKYLTPLRRGAKFLVKVRVSQIKGARMFLQHFIETLPDRELVLKATGTVVCLNKDYRPTRVFQEISSKLHKFFSSRDD